MSAPRLAIRGLSKTFTLHNQGGVRLEVLRDFSLDVRAGECIALDGPSGAGKSTVLKCIYANYSASSGVIEVQHGDRTIDMVSASSHAVLDIRRHTLGYVSQFLRVIPRVPARRIVADELLDADLADDDALAAADRLLARLRIPPSLAELPPATFSGGEQQRVNIARGFARPRPLLLLDEPTASLDAGNRAIVIDLIRAARDRGTAIVGIFHDAATREAVANRTVRVH